MRLTCSNSAHTNIAPMCVFRAVFVLRHFVDKVGSIARNMQIVVTMGTMTDGTRPL